MDYYFNVDDLDPPAYMSDANDEATWLGAYFAPGDAASRESTAMYFVIAPGKRLGLHYNTEEETHFYLSGRGELLIGQSARVVRSGDMVLVPKNAAHDLRNTGDEDLRVLGFFPRPAVRHVWSEETWDGQRVTDSPDA